MGNDGIFPLLPIIFAHPSCFPHDLTREIGFSVFLFPWLFLRFKQSLKAWMGFVISFFFLFFQSLQLIEC